MRRSRLFFLVLLWTVEVPDSLVGRHPMIALPVWLIAASVALGRGASRGAAATSPAVAPPS